MTKQSIQDSDLEMSNLKGKVPNFVKSMDLTSDDPIKKNGRNLGMNNRYGKNLNTKTIEFSQN